MSNLEWIGALMLAVLILTILIGVGLGVMSWAQGFTPDKDPNHNPHLPKEDKIPGEDWVG